MNINIFKRKSMLLPKIEKKEHKVCIECIGEAYDNIILTSSLWLAFDRGVGECELCKKYYTNYEIYYLPENKSGVIDNIYGKTLKYHTNKYLENKGAIK